MPSTIPILDPMIKLLFCSFLFLPVASRMQKRKQKLKGPKYIPIARPTQRKKALPITSPESSSSLLSSCGVIEMLVCCAAAGIALVTSVSLDGLGGPGGTYGYDAGPDCGGAFPTGTCVKLLAVSVCCCCGCAG
jgi:hypothetical protein